MKYLSFLVLWTGVLAFTTASCGDAQPPAQTTTQANAPTQAPVVATTGVKRAPQHTTHTLSARVEAPLGASPAFTMPGRITHRPVDVGDRVKQGDVLAKLDTAPFRLMERSALASIKQVDAQMAQLERDRKRAQRLLNRAAGSAESVEQIKSAISRMKAQREALIVQRDEARRLRREATLRAPFDGVITHVMLDVGDVTSPGKPVAMLGGQSDELEVTLMLPEALVAHIKVGDRVAIKPAMANLAQVDAAVRTVSSQALSQTGLYPVRVAFKPTPKWSAGMTVRAEIKHPTPSASWLVPLGAIIDPSGDAPHVLTVRDQVAVAVPVRLHAIIKQGALIGGAITSNEQLIIEGHFAVRPGARVEVFK